MKRTLIAMVILCLPAVGAAQAIDGEQLAQGCLAAGGKFDLTVAAYVQCVRLSADKLEPSGATPDEIADGARGQCATQATEVSRVAQICRQTYGFAGMTWAADAGVDERAKQAAVGEVLGLRAARAR